MSGWTEREKEGVKIIHHSTSSLIEIKIKRVQQVEYDKWEDVTETVWVDYESFSNLREVINQTDFP